MGINKSSYHLPFGSKFTKESCWPLSDIAALYHPESHNMKGEFLLLKEKVLLFYTP